MAHMIPSDGGYFDPRSKEEEMFNALKTLPDDYYVFHSYRLVRLIPGKGLDENEIDFLIFNPKYGCLFLECKNRTMRREGMKWEYLALNNGNQKWKPMQDPFTQAFSGQHNLFSKFQEIYYEDERLLSIINKCKIMVGVWLTKYSQEDIDNDIIGLGPTIAKEIILTSDELNASNNEKSKKSLLSKIENMMERMKRVHLVCKYEEEIITTPGYNHSATYEESMVFLKEVLSPVFRTAVNLRNDFERTYVELLEEQYVVLDFLAHQRTAAISGASGTGKTLVAIERARRLSQNNKKVLFLCYNRNLCDFLNKSYREELKNVDFFTIDSYGCKTCSVTLDCLSYYDLNEILENRMLENSFEYKHIIVDEGQDFGKERIDDAKILELLSEYGMGGFGDDDTSFFIFYDKNQLVNSNKIPSYIENVDSKLTLYKNCRNTKNIASTAYSLLGIEPILFDRAWDGDATKFIFYDTEEEAISKLDKLIGKISDDENSDRVIITCEDNITHSDIFSRLKNEDERNYYYCSNRHNTKVYTVPTFKGLEAENVILFDLNNKLFEKDNKMFYVGASRAKKHLFVFANRNKFNVNDAIEKSFKESFPMQSKEKQLAIAMHGLAQ